MDISKENASTNINDLTGPFSLEDFLQGLDQPAIQYNKPAIQVYPGLSPDIVDNANIKKSRKGDKMTKPKRTGPPELYGRNGDDTMLHISKGELQGLASLAPGGLTTNPDTGYPEAFNLWPVLAGLAIGGLGAMFLPAMLPAAAGALGIGGTAAGAGAAGAAGGLAGLGAIGAGEAGLASTLGGAALLPAATESVAGLGTAASALGGGAAGAMAAPAWGLGGVAGGIGNWMMNNPLPTMVMGSGIYDAMTAQSPKKYKDKYTPAPEMKMVRKRYQPGDTNVDGGNYLWFGQPEYVPMYAEGGMINQPQGMGSLQDVGGEDATRQFDREIVKMAMEAIAGRSTDPEGDIGRFVQRFGRQALADLAGKMGGGMSQAAGNGRLIQGPGTGTSDSIPGVIKDTGQPIAVSNGEYIMPAKAVRKHGLAAMEKMAHG